MISIYRLRLHSAVQLYIFTQGRRDAAPAQLLSDIALAAAVELHFNCQRQNSLYYSYLRSYTSVAVLLFFMSAHQKSALHYRPLSSRS